MNRSGGTKPPRGPRIDSGFNSIKAAKRNGPDYKINARFQKVTEFKRIRLSSLAAWMNIAKEDFERPETFDSGESVFDAAPDQPRPVHKPPSIMSMAETEATAVSGPIPHIFMPALYFPRDEETGAALRPKVPMGTREAVVLDLREPEEYEKLHIWGSYPYHHVNLNKSVNPLDNDLYLFFKRGDGMTVLVGDEDTPIEDAGKRLVELGAPTVIVLKQFFLDFAVAAPQLLEGTEAADFNVSETIKRRAKEGKARRR
ncbi:Rhodanese domain [Carpediemonas membranifera]|uniref:Rhodanese domain n=1 Tax=Carpediemonas membranifera TaxID=201153 RepID=A0A8J6E517_9EUKA|nr:Rhodanese domain [Carpediemonas membranifera]|eukprot:KAG9395197.1 Rhodanese domain [Carpediemonas membranifera]